MSSSSVLGNDRIVTLDVIRGFAILGIFLVNMPSFTGSEFMVYTGLDKTIRMLFDMFIQTKFYTIFSFLFGLGFYIFMTRAEDRGEKVFRLFSKRLFALLLFGIFHLVFLWEGDILHSYALIGFFLLLFYRRKAKTVLIWGLILILFFQFLTGASALLAYVGEQFDESLNISGQLQMERMEEGEKKIEAYTSLSYLELLKWRIPNELKEIIMNEPFVIPDVLGMFLLGLYAGKINLFRRVNELKRRLRIIQLITLLISILPLAAIVFSYLKLEEVVFMHSLGNYFYLHFSGFTLSIFYIVTIALMLEKQIWQRILNPFRYAGQMALTNYLCQTFFGVIVFYGFGLFGQITLAMGLLISLIFYFVQIIFSYLWLKKFQFGPFEWLWRVMTYGKVQQFRRT
ncbi:DUF418 domain-containing protein [Bacillus sp. DTU_2020_1000418_1_SI_GHA_SEK_038]|uniref:DUF418 domain-containing protein n=1 Tax=Bacillus sp. DTU_2020_1000418_1_SI_GHA_SEK_038 TaxID=3077585 RepID=UPI0028E1D21B|nr:DUF418 domain-containing protein [Bacillus sp. DTU_2020_1000418_1_SI_GHA_SEK_038]WNS76137.1 DUF418 domain-containing protein [Bacillus sp. DTU_2020_1000418_1_SI_GHA_SEK_038]